MKNFFSTYFFIASFLLANTASGAVEIKTGQAVEECAFDVTVMEVSPQTRCNDPDGELQAQVFDAVGNELQEGFTFAWYPTEYLNDPDYLMGMSQNAVQLEAGTYTVVVTEEATECVSTSQGVVTDETATPVLDLKVISAEETCDGSWGHLEVSLMDMSGSENISIRWYVEEEGGEVNELVKFKNSMVADELPAGFYTVQATNNNTSCNSDPLSAEILDLNNPPLVVGTITHNSACDAALSNGAISLDINTPSPGTEPVDGYSVAWYYGGGTDGEVVESDKIVDNGLQGVAAGIYTALVTNLDTQCQTQHSFVIEGQWTEPVLTLTSIQHNTVCDPEVAGAYNGALSVELHYNDLAVSNLEDYQISWYELNGDTETVLEGTSGLDIDQLPAGQYKVIATYIPTGCSSAPLIAEVQDAVVIPEVEISHSAPVTHCETPDGILEASAFTAGEAGVYSVEWYAGEGVDPANLIATVGNEEQVTGLAAGTYTVIAIDQQSGCVSAPVTISLEDETEAPVLALQVSSHLTSCEDAAGTELTASLSPEADYTLYWYFGPEADEGNRIENEAGLSLSGYPAGVYTAQAINNSTQCVSNIVSAEINDLTALPLVDESITHNTACENALSNGSISLQISTPSPGSEPENGYQVEWFYGEGTEGEVVESEKLTDNGLQNLPAGSYTVLVSHPESKCQTQQSFMVEDHQAVPQLSLASAPQANSVCDPELAGAAAYTGAFSVELMYQDEAVAEPADFRIRWYTIHDNSETLLVENSSLSIEQLPAGQYKVEAVHAATGCTSEPLVVEIEDATSQPQVEVASITPLTHCENQNGAIEIAQPQEGEAEAYSIAWYEGTQTNQEFLLADLSDQFIATGLSAGSYTVVLSYQPTGCSSEPLTLQLEDATAAPAITVVSSPLSNCNPERPNGSFSFEADGLNEGYSFELFKGTEADPTEKVGEGTEFQGLDQGEYLLLVTNETSACQSSRLLEITSDVSYPDAPQTIGAESCEAAELTLSVEGDQTYYWYRQSTGGTAFHAGESYFELFTETTTFYVSTVSDDACESPERSPVSALIYALPEPDLAAEGNMLSTAEEESYTYRWYLDGELLPNEHSHQLRAEEEGSYVVEIINEAGCSRQSAPYVFTVSAVIDQAFDAGILLYPNPSSGILHVEFRKGAGPVSIKIRDSQMKLLKNMPIKGSEAVTTLHLADLPQGLYIVEIREGNRVSYRRITKQ